MDCEIQNHSWSKGNLKIYARDRRTGTTHVVDGEDAKVDFPELLAAYILSKTMLSKSAVEWKKWAKLSTAAAAVPSIMAKPSKIKDGASRPRGYQISNIGMDHDGGNIMNKAGASAGENAPSSTDSDDEIECIGIAPSTVQKASTSSSAGSFSKTTDCSISKINNRDVILSPNGEDVTQQQREHPGNITFRRVINLNKGLFKATSMAAEKLRIAKAIVASVSERGGRFLERHNNGVWRTIGYRKSLEMTIHVLKKAQMKPKMEEEAGVNNDGVSPEKVANASNYSARKRPRDSINTTLHSETEGVSRKAKASRKLDPVAARALALLRDIESSESESDDDDGMNNKKSSPTADKYYGSSSICSNNYGIQYKTASQTAHVLENKSTNDDESVNETTAYLPENSTNGDDDAHENSSLLYDDHVNEMAKNAPNNNPSPTNSINDNHQTTDALENNSMNYDDPVNDTISPAANGRGDEIANNVHTKPSPTNSIHDKHQTTHALEKNNTNGDDSVNDNTLPAADDQGDKMVKNVHNDQSPTVDALENNSMNNDVSVNDNTLPAAGDHGHNKPSPTNSIHDKHQTVDAHENDSMNDDDPVNDNSLPAADDQGDKMVKNDVHNKPAPISSISYKEPIVVKKDEEETDDDDEVMCMGVVPAPARAAATPVETKHPETSTNATMPPATRVKSEPVVASRSDKVLVFTHKQSMQYSKYPVGCPVWFNLKPSPTSPERQPSSHSSMGTIRTGLVRSVSLNMGKRDLLFGVNPVKNLNPQKNNIKAEEELGNARLTETFFKEQLAFASSCPVYVCLKEGTDEMEGEIITCKWDYLPGNNGSKMSYMVMIFLDNGEKQIFDRVKEDCIRYREEDATLHERDELREKQTKNEEPQDASDEETHTPVEGASNEQPHTPAEGASNATADDTTEIHSKPSSVQGKLSSTHKTSNEGSPSANSSSVTTILLQKKSNTLVSTKKAMDNDESCASSITDDDLGSNEIAQKQTSERGVSQLSPSICRARTSFYLDDGYSRLPPDDENDDGRLRMRIDIPMWLQQNLSLRASLFEYLIGSDPGKRRGHRVKEISDKTRCSIHIRHSEAMHLIVTTRLGGDAQGRLNEARDMIGESIFEIAKNDGSIGRCYYDFARLYPENEDFNSASNAVLQWNPFSGVFKQSWMTVMPLPFVRVHTNKNEPKDEFHGSFIVSLREKIWIKTVCQIRVCGDSFDVPTKYCDPYVFIFGRCREDVDNAFNIVQEAISCHRSNCTCSLPEQVW